MTTTAATTPAPPAVTMGVIAHVVLTVADLSASVPWYEEIIGARPVLDEDTGPFRHVVFALGGTPLALHAFPEGVLDDAPFNPRRPGLDHVAFGCADRAELATWAARLDQLGVPHGEILAAHYGSALAFKDPDGLPLEFFCPPAS